MSETPATKALPRDIASLAVCSLIWGTTWFAIKLEVGAVPVFNSVVYRFALAAALLVVFCVVTRRTLGLSLGQHLLVLGQGLSGFTVQYACVYLAEERIASGAMAVIFAATPFVNLVLFRLLLRQRASILAWAGTLLGLGGVACMSVAEIRAAGDGDIGVLLALVGVLAAAVSNLFASKVQAAGVATAAGTAWAMGYGAALLAVVVTVTGGRWRFDPSVGYVGGLLYLTVFGSVTAFIVYYSLARRRGYAFASYVAALTPPTAMLVSWLFEGARWGLAAFAGLVLVLAGQGLLIRATRSRAAA